MIDIKPQITWELANNLVFAVADVLSSKQQTFFYDFIREARVISENPNDVVTIIFQAIKELQDDCICPR